METNTFQFNGVVKPKRFEKKHDKPQLFMKHIQIGDEYSPGKYDPTTKTRPTIRYYTDVKLYAYDSDYKYPFVAYNLVLNNPGAATPLYCRITQRSDLYKLMLTIRDFLNDNKEAFDRLEKTAKTYQLANVAHHEWEQKIENDDNPELIAELYSQTVGLEPHPSLLLKYQSIPQQLTDYESVDIPEEHMPDTMLRQIASGRLAPLKPPKTASDYQWAIDFAKTHIVPSDTEEGGSPHKDLGLMQCPYCENEYDKRKSLSEHVRTKHKELHIPGTSYIKRNKTT